MKKIALPNKSPRVGQVNGSRNSGFKRDSISGISSQDEKYAAKF
jgi:hypothetical protein